MRWLPVALVLPLGLPASAGARPVVRIAGGGGSRAWLSARVAATNRAGNSTPAGRVRIEVRA